MTEVRMNRELASVWIRLGAIVIDSLILFPFYIPWWVLNARAVSDHTFEPSPALLSLNFLLIFVALVFGFWNVIYRMGKTGQSLGRKFLNIAVLDESGRPIGVGRAALREIIGRWLSAIVCYIGYLNAFWDKKRQMWHDKIANCYVYYVDDKFS